MIHEQLKVIVDRMGIGALSRKSGIGERTLRTYLSGSTSPSSDKLAAIVKASGDDANWVLFGGKYKTAEEVANAISESLFFSIFDEVHTEGNTASVERSLLRLNISHAIRIYNEAVSLPGDPKLRASLILTQEEKKMMCRLIGIESGQSIETQEEENFMKRQIQRYEARLSELNEKEAALVREIGSDYKVYPR